MIAQPVDGSHFLRERLPHERVREAEPPRPVGQLVEEPRPHRLVQQPKNPFRLGTAGPGQEPGREAAAHQRRQLQRPPRRGAQAVQTPPQHLADASRQTERLIGAKRRQTSLRPEHPHQLGGEERVSPGGAVNPGGGGHTGRLPDDGGQMLGELRPVQPVQTDPAGLGAAAQIGERGGDRRVRCHLLLTERHHEQHRVTPKLPHQVAKQQHRGRVSPVRIVQHDHQATLPRRDPQQRRRRVEQPESGLPTVVGAPAGWGRGGPHALVRSLELRHHPVQGGRSALQPLPLGGIRPQQLVPHDLDPGPEGGRSLTLGSPAPPDRYASGFGLRGQPDGQGGLADPRLPRDEHGPARSTERLAQGSPQLPQLRRPSDEGSTRRGDTPRAHLQNVACQRGPWYARAWWTSLR
jgi:hypothetical protein